MHPAQAMKQTGFDVCLFEPDESPCENCGATHVQLYFRRSDYWTEDGVYFCQTCVVNEAIESEADLSRNLPNETD